MFWQNYSRIEDFDNEDWEYQVQKNIIRNENDSPEPLMCFLIKYNRWKQLFLQDYERNFQNFFDFEVFP